MSDSSPILLQTAERMIDTIRDRVMRDFVDIHENPPPVLFHYTKNEGLMGILGGERPSIRATHAAFLNDPRELIYAEEVLRDFFEKRVSAYPDPDDVRAMLYVALRARLPRMRQERDVYVFSLSEKDDDLSQWQAYSAGGYGYTIGFHSEELKRIYPSSPRTIFLRRIVYLKEEEQLYFLNKVAKAADDFILPLAKKVPDKRGREMLAMQFALLLGEILEEFLVSFKHRAFRSEAEWRLCVMNRAISIGRSTEPTPGLDFIGARGRLTPFVPIPLFEPQRQVERFVASVRLGPALDTTIDKRTLELFLERWALYKVQPLESDIRLK